MCKISSAFRNLWKAENVSDGSKVTMSSRRRCCDGKTAWAVCLGYHVIARGMTKSLWVANQRWQWLLRFPTGMHILSIYDGVLWRRHLKVNRHTLYFMHCETGSQCSSSRITRIIWLYFLFCKISFAAALRTNCRGHICTLHSSSMKEMALQ